MTYRPVSIPSLPSTADPALRQFLSSIKEALEVRLQQRGNPLDSAPTFRDLMDAGIIQLKDGVSVGGTTYTANQLLGLIEFTLPSWITSDTAPPPPTGLTVSAFGSTVTLTWDTSTFDQYGRTEVWRATANNLTLAKRVGSTTGTTYVDSLPAPAQVYYYWIRDVSRSGIKGSFNDVNGIGTITGPAAPSVSWQLSSADVVFSWATPSSNLTIQYFLVEVWTGISWSEIDIVGGNLYRTRVTWPGSRQFRFRGVDVQGNVGPAGETTVTIAMPTAPSPTVSYDGDSVVLKWPTHSGGSLPPASYRIYQTSVLPSNLLSDQLSTTFRAKVLWSSRTFLVTVVDTAGNESPAASVVATVQPPAQPVVQALLNGEYVQLSFASAGGSLPIAYYDLRFGATWAGGVPLGVISGSTFSVRADWSGDRTFWVVATDTSENNSAPASVVVNVEAPEAPSVTKTFSGVTAVLEWEAVTGSLPVAFYEIRYGSAYGTGTFVERISGTSVAVPVDWLGLRTYWVAAIDTLGNTGSAGSCVVDVVAPSAPAITTAFSGPNAVINWTASAASLPVAEYELRLGPVFASATSLGRVKGTTFSTRANWSGERTFWVAGVDQNGNLGAPGAGAVIVTLPPAPVITTEVIDNNVLLRWNPVQGTLPTETYELRKGASWAAASVIGEKAGAFTIVFETAAGSYTYWLAAIDSAGNYGAPASATTTVAQPPDYFLAADFTSDFSGTKSNAFLGEFSGALILPVDTTQTWTTHFTDKSWNSPQNQIDAGYPRFIQPGAQTGYYEETIDYGAVMAAMKVSVTYLLTTLGGTVADTVQITTALDSGFTTNVQTVTGKQVFAVNFRYIRFRITVTSPNDQGVASISDLTIKLDAKLKSDAGTALILPGAAHVQGNLSLDYLSLWQPSMTMPPAGFTLRGIAAESRISTINGPGGLPEPVWACVDKDAATDSDGGWQATTYVPVDTTKGHLVAVFMRKANTVGTSYFGLNNNSTILTLAGAVNANPYFWSGASLPAINTWYLLVGYVYPIGYGTTDGGISGIYNLTGTKLVSATSYKFNTGATSLMHRVFLDSQTAASDAEVQWMARPVVLQCDAADATSVISYILTCAVELGGSGDFTTQFIDVTSLTVSPRLSSAPTIPIYDFTDIPYPKRFNVFNYTTAGVLTSGELGWAARGY